MPLKLMLNFTLIQHARVQQLVFGQAPAHYPMDLVLTTQPGIKVSVGSIDS